MIFLHCDCSPNYVHVLAVYNWWQDKLNIMLHAGCIHFVRFIQFNINAIVACPKQMQSIETHRRSLSVK